MLPEWPFLPSGVSYQADNVDSCVQIIFFVHILYSLTQLDIQGPTRSEVHAQFTSLVPRPYKEEKRIPLTPVG